MKGCGKSAPGDGQPDPHGKPHPEQGRIGAARHGFGHGWGVSPQGLGLRPPGLAAGALRQRKAKRNGCRSAHVRKETARITEPGLQAPRHFFIVDFASTCYDIKMDYSDSIIYGDENGNGNLTNDGPNYSMFVLAFVFFVKMITGNRFHHQYNS